MVINIKKSLSFYLGLDNNCSIVLNETTLDDTESIKALWTLVFQISQIIHQLFKTELIKLISTLIDICFKNDTFPIAYDCQRKINN